MNWTYRRRRVRIKLRSLKPTRLKLAKGLTSLPLVGSRIEQYILSKYNPTERLTQLEKVGRFGARYYFEPLAPTRDQNDWMFKVYTSQKAQDRLGIVTTIYYDIVPVRYNDEKVIDQAFRFARRRFEIFMNERFTDHEWESIADGNSFKLNATKKVAKDGVEISLKDYLKERYDVEVVA